MFCAPFLVIDHQSNESDSDASSSSSAATSKNQHASPALAFVMVTNHRVVMCPRATNGAPVSAVGSHNVQCLLQDVAHIYCSSQSLEMIVRVCLMGYQFRFVFYFTNVDMICSVSIFSSISCRLSFIRVSRLSSSSPPHSDH